MSLQFIIIEEKKGEVNMHKIHVTASYKKSLTEVFSTITDHRKFLSGGGLTCHIIKPGIEHKNGLGAIRTVRSKKYTLTEEITAFVENKSYDYLIKEVKPAMAFTHHNGWLEFTEADNQVRVDWHSHFTFTTPIIGHLIGWLAKKQIEKVFL